MAPNVIEQRRSERKAPAGLVDIFDVVMGEAIGHLGNVSPEGLMLISNDVIAEGAIFQLQFSLSDLDGLRSDFSVGATCLWSMESNSGSYWSGLQIIDMSDEDNDKLRELHGSM